jgi:hypothetical protein
MAHDRLFPKSKKPFLTPEDVLARLSTEFSGLRVDRKQAEEHMRRMIQQLRLMSDLTPPPASKEQIARLEQVTADSIYVVIADAGTPNGVSLTACIIPGEPLFFGYSSSKHQADTRSLLLRCARSLQYEIENG